MRKRKWLRSLLVLAVVVPAASIGFSRALRTEAARHYLIANLAASFGRPVEVSRFDFSLLDGARLEAHSVTVAEDPQFGNEYFLRAETLTAGLRWRALLSGRFEFGSFSLQRPSLNLVRDAEGHWNLERWLPPSSSAASHPGFVGPPAAPGPIHAARLYRIQVDGGRINFKQRDDKSPFALLDVSGQVEEDSSGRWQLDLEARPMRAGVELQDIGTLRLRGTVAGTSARLQPAELNLTWREASLADALRLAREEDYGMRGQLSMDISARIGPPEPALLIASESSAAQWTISGVARLTGIHGWRLPPRDTDPAANVSLEAAWQLGRPRAQIRKLIVEMPSSHLQGSGDLDWGRGFQPQFHIESSSVGLNDILLWYRALRPDVAEDLRAEGSLGVDVLLGGWPLELQQGAIAGVAGALMGSSIPAPLRIGSMNASVSRGGLDIAPTQVFFDPLPSNSEDTTAKAGDLPKSFVLRGSIFPETNRGLRWPLNWNFSMEGETPRAQDWAALSEALAQPWNLGWTAAGDVAIRMRGSHQAELPATAWLGTADFLDFTATSGYVNQPVHFSRTHIEFTPAERTVTLFAVEALGASWHGTISQKTPDKQWTFDLAADHLDTADLDRWLGPRARPSFLSRITSLGTTVAAPPEDDSGISKMIAHGRLRVGEIVMSRLRLEQFDGQAELDGRTIRIRNAQADFFGGKVEGSLDALLLRDPSYEFHGRFDRVDLAQLGRSFPFLENRMGGTASGALAMAAHGIGRENLIASLIGNGTLGARNVKLSDFELEKAFPEEDLDPPLAPFASVQGDFRIRAAGIDLAHFELDHPRGRLQADGRIDFSHTLNLRVRPSIFQAAAHPTAAFPPTFLLTGTIENPKLTIPASSQPAKSVIGKR